MKKRPIKFYKYEDENGYIIVQSIDYNPKFDYFSGVVVESTKDYHQVGYVSTGFNVNKFKEVQWSLS